jgi:archaemetzincin
MSWVCLVPIYLSHPRATAGRLAERLAETFRMPVRVHRPWFDPELAFDASRGQYNSTVLLAMLLGGDGVDGTAEKGARILGVTGVDLFIPVLTYVFGEAQLDGRAAVVSTHRLASEAYGLAADEALLAERLAKEATHELGHTYGLIHCPDPECVMHASTYVEEIDLKLAGFCEACAGRLTSSPSAPATR